MAWGWHGATLAIIVAIGDRYRSHHGITDGGQHGDKKKIELEINAVLPFEER